MMFTDDPAGEVVEPPPWQLQAVAQQRSEAAARSRGANAYRTEEFLYDDDEFDDG